MHQVVQTWPTKDNLSKPSSGSNMDNYGIKINVPIEYTLYIY